MNVSCSHEPDTRHETSLEKREKTRALQTTIEPLPIGRRNKPGLRWEHLEDLIAASTLPPAQTTAPPHITDTMQPTLPSQVRSHFNLMYPTTGRMR
jgi:hypothetical protein